MILLPLPRFVLPTPDPFFGRGTLWVKGTIDEAFAEIKVAAFGKVHG